MVKPITIIAIAAVCLTAVAGNIVFYNPASSVVTNRVTLYAISRDPGPLPWTNKLVDPILPENFHTLRRDFFKVEGTNIVELTQGEKDSITAAETTSIVASEKEDAKSTYDVSRLERAFAQILLNEINALRTNPSATLPARTLIQLRNAIRAEIDSQP